MASNKQSIAISCCMFDNSVKKTIRKFLSHILPPLSLPPSPFYSFLHPSPSFSLLCGHVCVDAQEYHMSFFGLHLYFLRQLHTQGWQSKHTTMPSFCFREFGLRSLYSAEPSSGLHVLFAFQLLLRDNMTKATYRRKS